MKKIFCLCLTLLVVVQISLSQDEFFETWYKVNDGDGPSRERITVTPNEILVELLQDYQVDTPYWKLDKKSPIIKSQEIANGIQIIGYDKKKKTYTAGELVYGTSTDQILFFQLQDTSSVIEKISQLIDTNKYKKIFRKPFYSKAKIEDIEAYPSLDLISKEEIITVFSFIITKEDLITSYLEENKDVRYARMLAIRALESLRDQKFIEMGFNPYRMTQEYYGDRFKDDPDLIEINEKSKYFKLF